MGTHPSVPSVNSVTHETLREIIKSDPKKYLGEGIIEKFGSDKELPFLFKVLSIEKVLSIQAHPDKELGARLHAEDPKNYPDPNHKPEMAIAITEFEGFCGFRPLDQLAGHLKKIPEFHELIGDELVAEFCEGIVQNAKDGSKDDENNRLLLQKVFGKLMNTSQEAIAAKAASLVERAASDSALFGKSLADLIIRLNKQFPQDIGLFCGCLMLNHCHLLPGEAMFLQAKDPHAYISGDIIECMAASDNVVRVGFTPKFKDVKNLVQMLTYAYGDVEKQKMVAKTFERSHGDAFCRLYDPPILEFSVLQTILTKGIQKTEKLDGPSIVLCTNGKGSIAAENATFPVNTGNVFFVAPGAAIELRNESDEEFITFRAFVEA